MFIGQLSRLTRPGRTALARNQKWTMFNVIFVSSCYDGQHMRFGQNES